MVSKFRWGSKISSPKDGSEVDPRDGNVESDKRRRREPRSSVRPMKSARDRETGEINISSAFSVNFHQFDTFSNPSPNITCPKTQARSLIDPRTCWASGRMMAALARSSSTVETHRKL